MRNDGSGSKGGWRGRVRLALRRDREADRIAAYELPYNPHWNGAQQSGIGDCHSGRRCTGDGLHLDGGVDVARDDAGDLPAAFFAGRRLRG